MHKVHEDSDNNDDGAGERESQGRFSFEEGRALLSFQPLKLLQCDYE